MVSNMRHGRPGRAALYVSFLLSPTQGKACYLAGQKQSKQTFVVYFPRTMIPDAAVKPFVMLLAVS